MSKQEMREQTERLVREAMEKKSIAIKKVDTRIEATCGKCGAKNRLSVGPEERRVQFTCKECGQEQKAM